MDRRSLLSFIALSATSFGVSGCKSRAVRFDPPPKRSLFEDRWPGFYFETIDAKYSLRLHNTTPLLSRPSGIAIPIVSGATDAPSHVADPPTVRPTQAIVDLTYSTDIDADSQVTVAVQWPRVDGREIKEGFTTEEAFTAPLTFDNIRRFIDGTGCYRCDPNEHFYGQVFDDDKQSRETGGVEVIMKISGPNPGSRFQGPVKYCDIGMLHDIARLAVPRLS